MRYILGSLLAVFLFPQTGVISQSLTEISAGADANRKKTLISLEEQIRVSVNYLEKNYDLLKTFGRIDDLNQTIIAMTSVVETEAGNRNQYIYTEDAMILWQDQKIANVVFNTVRGRAGGGYVQKKRYSLLEDAPHKEGGNYGGTINIVLNIRESFESGAWDYSEFRFTDVPKLPAKEMITTNGVPMNFKVFYVDDMDRKIVMLREYLEHLRLLEMRSHRVITDAQKKQKKQIEKVIGSF